MTSTCPPADALSALVDDALPPAAREVLLAHSAACPHCAAQLAELRALHEAFQALPATPLGFDLGARVIAHLQADAPAVARRSPPRPRWREFLKGVFTPVLAWRDALVPLVGTTAALGFGVVLGGMLLMEEEATPSGSPSVTLVAMSLFDAVPPGNLCPRADACAPKGSLR
jgi:anti-sigma factor RsiW